VGTVRRAAYDYALLRAVPRVERGECLNVGVVLFSKERDLLELAVHLDQDRLRALDPGVDVDGVREAVEALRRTCAGDGPAGGTSLGQRFRWLTAPRSTVLQAGPVHSGTAEDPAAELQRLLTALVR
jgi:hypothetical protein